MTHESPNCIRFYRFLWQLIADMEYPLSEKVASEVPLKSLTLSQRILVLELSTVGNCVFIFSLPVKILYTLIRSHHRLLRSKAKCLPTTQAASPGNIFMNFFCTLTNLMTSFLQQSKQNCTSYSKCQKGKVKRRCAWQVFGCSWNELSDTIAYLRDF